MFYATAAGAGDIVSSGMDVFIEIGIDRFWIGDRPRPVIFLR